MPIIDLMTDRVFGRVFSEAQNISKYPRDTEEVKSDLPTLCCQYYLNVGVGIS